MFSIALCQPKAWPFLRITLVRQDRRQVHRHRRHRPPPTLSLTARFLPKRILLQGTFIRLPQLARLCHPCLRRGIQTLRCHHKTANGSIFQVLMANTSSPMISFLLTRATSLQLPSTLNLMHVASGSAAWLHRRRSLPLESGTAIARGNPQVSHTAVKVSVHRANHRHPVIIRTCLGRSTKMGTLRRLGPGQDFNHVWDSPSQSLVKAFCSPVPFKQPQLHCLERLKRRMATSDACTAPLGRALRNLSHLIVLYTSMIRGLIIIIGVRCPSSSRKPRTPCGRPSLPGRTGSPKVTYPNLTHRFNAAGA